MVTRKIIMSELKCCSTAAQGCPTGWFSQTGASSTTCLYLSHEKASWIDAHVSFIIIVGVLCVKP